MQRNSVFRPFAVFAQFVLTLMALVLALATVFIARQGMSVQLVQTLGLFVACLGLLAVTERLTTGRWFRWSRR
ncbi:hypothetical protein ABZ864_40360 [Streptomyces sp. NPDC047082]|uniref:hypothetical protein n=1 Tax=Streptomyces sp. NPDC047082 TaxID=3155259 RepID=UPI0033D25725